MSSPQSGDPERTRIELVISPRERDLGGFSVRRVLPYAARRMVGPFVFFDHMGPAQFPPGQGLDVRPHPHIGLSTVTYLFEGKIRHRDSLGNDRLIEPGAINWMTAGRGIVHSERLPDDVRAAGGRLDGIQLWVALPKESEEAEPSFRHHPAEEFPEFEVEGARVRLLLGSAFGRKSPAAVHSNMFYLDVRLRAGGSLDFPAPGLEAAAYVAHGSAAVNGMKASRFTMAVAPTGEGLSLVASEEGARVMILGGESVGPRLIHWNFVASTQEMLERAKAHWAKGPGAPNSPFPLVPGDEVEYIPLPGEP